MAKYTATSIWKFNIAISPAPARLAKMFGEAAREFSDFHPAFLRLAPKIKAGIKRIIDSKGASLGDPWPGLKDKYYLARKARKGWSRAELFGTGLLVNSIDTVSMTKKALKVGTWVPYSKAIQWGRAGKNQSRKFIALDPQAIKDATEELNVEANAIFARLASKIGQAA